jgi:cellulose synthase/poly-beta-1,6-N-acetylglucosamine synthase-like glycosyltransferase
MFDLLAWVALVVYVAVSASLFVYGSNWYFFTAHWILSRRRTSPVRKGPDGFPRVTVQIPVYNERYVVRRIMHAIASFEWPRDRLEIQVLDDSDDDTTGVIERTVRDLRGHGTVIHHIRRPSREGYKAGALAFGLSQASGDFIAIFDCDFAPPPDFLVRTIPEFEDPAIGFVQTRWGHLNRDYSQLTRALAVGVDGHFVVEQETRFRNGFLMNFNGTAGIWRRVCIEDAGGWTGDTLAEDLDLSYRAQLRGWRCAYRKDVVSPAELPAQLTALKRQQFRWARGSIQVLRKHARAVVSSRLTLGQKVQALLHLSLYLVHPLMLVSFLLLPPLLIFGNLHPLIPAIFATAAFGPASMYVVSQIESERERWLSRSLSLLLLTPLGIGQCLNNSRAVVGGLLGHRSPFLRTPKFGIEGKHGTWRGTKYAIRTSGETLAESGLAVYGLSATLVAAAIGNFWALTWLTLFTVSFTLVAALSVWHSVGGVGDRMETTTDAGPT